jgi:hypothetical protein
MDINAIVLLLMASVVGFYTWQAFLHKDDPAPSALPWVPIDVNKHRSFVSMTRDAGMFTERTRRCTIINSGRGGATQFKQKGSTNGSLEWLFLTGVCPGRPLVPGEAICPPAPKVVWSDGDADDEICDGVDAGGAFGGYDAVDFGGAGGNDCDV